MELQRRKMNSIKRMKQTPVAGLLQNKKQIKQSRELDALHVLDYLSNPSGCHKVPGPRM
jgi:hypothetical protein